MIKIYSKYFASIFISRLFWQRVIRNMRADDVLLVTVAMQLILPCHGHPELHPMFIRDDFPFGKKEFGHTHFVCSSRPSATVTPQLSQKPHYLTLGELSSPISADRKLYKLTHALLALLLRTPAEYSGSPSLYSIRRCAR